MVTGSATCAFLPMKQLLVLTSDSHIELYNIRDLSKAPQLQLRFMMPLPSQQEIVISFGFPQCFNLAQVSPHQMNLEFGPRRSSDIRGIILCSSDKSSHKFQMYMTDFSLSAVMRGISEVVRERTIFENFACRY